MLFLHYSDKTSLLTQPTGFHELSLPTHLDVAAHELFHADRTVLRDPHCFEALAVLENIRPHLLQRARKDNLFDAAEFEAALPAVGVLVVFPERLGALSEFDPFQALAESKSVVPDHLQCGRDSDALYSASAKCLVLWVSLVGVLGLPEKLQAFVQLDVA